MLHPDHKKLEYVLCILHRAVGQVERGVLVIHDRWVLGGFGQWLYSIINFTANYLLLSSLVHVPEITQMTSRLVGRSDWDWDWDQTLQCYVKKHMKKHIPHPP